MIGIGINLQSVALPAAGTPSWIPIADGIAADVALDFINDRYWVKGSGYVPVTALLNVSRASAKYVTTSSGLQVQVAANALARSDLGANIEEGRTNLALWSQDLTNAAWTSSITGSGALAAATSAAVAPDGTATATLISASRSATADQAVRLATFNATAASYAGTFYVQAATAGDVGKQIGIFFYNGTVGLISQTVALTASWQRVALAGTLSAETSYVGIGLVGGIGTQTGPVGINVWGAQAELGSFPTSYIFATTAAATRAADLLTFAGTADTILKSGVFTALTKGTGSPTSTPTIVGCSGAGTPIYSASNTVARSNNGTTQLNATAGSGGFSAGYRIGYAQDATGRSLAFNGGALASDSSPLAAGSSYYEGSTGSANFVNNLTQITALWASRRTNAAVSTLAA